jgi:hypothetical protein
MEHLPGTAEEGNILECSKGERDAIHDSSRVLPP